MLFKCEYLQFFLHNNASRYTIDLVQNKCFFLLQQGLKGCRGLKFMNYNKYRIVGQQYKTYVK